MPRAGRADRRSQHQEPFFRKSGTSTSSKSTRRGGGVDAAGAAATGTAEADGVPASAGDGWRAQLRAGSDGRYDGVPPSKPAAITVTRTSSPSASSMTAPKMML